MVEIVIRNLLFNSGLCLLVGVSFVAFSLDQLGAIF